jgi:hypothetical protein
MTRHVLGTTLLVFACACTQEAPLDIDAHMTALCAVPPAGLALVDTEGLVSMELPPKAIPVAVTVSARRDSYAVDGVKVTEWPPIDGLKAVLLEKRAAALGEAAAAEPAKEEGGQEEEAALEEKPAQEEKPAEGEESEEEAEEPEFSAPVNVLIEAAMSTEQIASVLGVLEKIGFDKAFLVVTPGGESAAPAAPDPALAAELSASLREASSMEARHKVLAEAVAGEAKTCDAVAEVFRGIAEAEPVAQCSALQANLPKALESCEGQVHAGRVLTVGQVLLLPVGPLSGLEVELSARGGFVSVPKSWTWADLAPRVAEYDGKPFRIVAE